MVEHYGKGVDQLKLNRERQSGNSREAGDKRAIRRLPAPEDAYELADVTV
jgi:hypothetical protein